ncbi:hypothetical protein B0H16DRAFT_1486399 [Mycena metata]|uniref:Uncharacterized protein n=1 Tax=Mycena metata TaxID=1033252 RepID=A0AAD7DIL9_9AGAR|nr:hypothetical protein B0H16DRAFT_1486399 [Mycena metata]
MCAALGMRGQLFFWSCVQEGGIWGGQAQSCGWYGPAHDEAVSGGGAADCGARRLGVCERAALPNGVWSCTEYDRVRARHGAFGDRLCRSGGWRRGWSVLGGLNWSLRGGRGTRSVRVARRNLRVSVIASHQSSMSTRILYVLTPSGKRDRILDRPDWGMDWYSRQERARYLVSESSGFHSKRGSNKSESKGPHPPDHVAVFASEQLHMAVHWNRAPDVSVDIMSFPKFTALVNKGDGSALLKHASDYDMVFGSHFTSRELEAQFVQRLEKLGSTIFIWPSPRQTMWYRQENKIVQQLDHLAAHVTRTLRPQTWVLTDVAQFTDHTVLKRKTSWELSAQHFHNDKTCPDAAAIAEAVHHNTDLVREEQQDELEVVVPLRKYEQWHIFFIGGQMVGIVGTTPVDDATGEIDMSECTAVFALHEIVGAMHKTADPHRVLVWVGGSQAERASSMAQLEAFAQATYKGVILEAEAMFNTRSSLHDFLQMDVSFLPNVDGFDYFVNGIALDAPAACMFSAHTPVGERVGDELLGHLCARVDQHKCGPLQPAREPVSDWKPAAEPAMVISCCTLGEGASCGGGCSGAQSAAAISCSMSSSATHSGMLHLDLVHKVVEIKLAVGLCDQGHVNADEIVEGRSCAEFPLRSGNQRFQCEESILMQFGHGVVTTVLCSTRSYEDSMRDPALSDDVAVPRGLNKLLHQPQHPECGGVLFTCIQDHTVVGQNIARSFVFEDGGSGKLGVFFKHFCFRAVRMGYDCGDAIELLNQQLLVTIPERMAWIRPDQGLATQLVHSLHEEIMLIVPSKVARELLACGNHSGKRAEGENSGIEVDLGRAGWVFGEKQGKYGKEVRGQGSVARYDVTVTSQFNLPPVVSHEAVCIVDFSHCPSILPNTAFFLQLPFCRPAQHHSAAEQEHVKQLCKISRMPNLVEQCLAHVPQSYYKDLRGNLYTVFRCIWVYDAILQTNIDAVEIKAGYSSDTPHRQQEYQDTCHSINFDWQFKYTSDNVKRLVLKRGAEHLVYLSLRMLGAGIPAYPCPRCGVRHKEFFSVAAARGIDRLCGIIEFWLEVLGEPVNNYPERSIDNGLYLDMDCISLWNTICLINCAPDTRAARVDPGVTIQPRCHVLVRRYPFQNFNTPTEGGAMWIKAQLPQSTPGPQQA